MLQELGKVLIFLGFVLMGIGLFLIWAPPFRLGRLPGDLVIRRENWVLHLPLGKCLLLSVVLSLVFWLANWFRR